MKHIVAFCRRLISSFCMAEDPATDEEIEHFLTVFTEAVDTMYLLQTLMYKIDPLSDAEIANFRAAASYYGQLLRREDKLDTTVTIKAHMLESHCADYLEEHRRLGNLSEQPIEREHSEMKTLLRRFNNDDRFVSVQSNITKHINLCLTPAVAAKQKEIFEHKTRKFSIHTREQRKEKEDGRKAKKEERLANVMLNINLQNEF